jgi:hypothetical protein
MKHIAELYEKDPERACALALARVQHKSYNTQLVSINHLLEGYGVEPIFGGYKDPYWTDIVALYVNMAIYNKPTVIHVRENDTFVISSVYEWVNNNTDKYKIL